MSLGHGKDNRTLRTSIILLILLVSVASTVLSLTPVTAPQQEQAASSQRLIFPSYKAPEHIGWDSVWHSIIQYAQSIFVYETNWFQRTVGSFTERILIPTAYATSIIGPPDKNMITYVDPSFASLGGGNYRYTTSFGVYDFTYQATTKLYLISYNAPDGSVLVQASTYVLWENSTGSYLPVNLQPTRFQIDAPTLVTTPLRFEADWPLNYYTSKTKTQLLGTLVLIVDFQKSAFPKQSVHLSLDSYQVDPKCVNTPTLECARETYWNDVGLKDRYWSWMQAPADKTTLTNGSENLKVSSNTWNTVTTSKSKQETLTPVSTTTPLTVNEQIQFNGSVSWYADWEAATTQETALEPSSSTKNLLSSPIVSTAFAVNMDYVDPTFGLTSAGSTSYPTAKAVTANGTAQIDTAQSVFGGASGVFDGNSDYLTLDDSADWYFAGGDFTIDFRVRFNALPAAGTNEAFYVQRVDLNNQIVVVLYNNLGTYQWNVAVVSGASTIINQVATSNPNIAVNTWYHFAWVRSGNNSYIFQDGTQVGATGTFVGACPDLAASIYIATRGSLLTQYLDGWLDEFRVSKGVARWTSNFTPPTARYDRDGCVSGAACASPDSYTVLLLHNDGADASTTFLDDVTTGQAKATSASCTTISTATSISFYSHAAGNVRLAIYSDVLGAPSAKLWESGDTAVSATAWATVNIADGTPSTLALAVATYWLTWQWNPGTAYLAGPSYTAGSANTGDYIYQAYAAFPATWTGGTLSAENWSMYVTYSTIVAYTRTATAQMTQSAVNARTENVPRTNTAQMTQAPSLLRIENLPRASSQALSAVLTLPIIIHYGKAVSATITSSISDSRTLSLPKTLTQGITTSLSTSRILGLFVSVSQTITNSASNARISSLIREIGQSLASGFSLLIVSTLTRLVNQGITPSVTASRIIGLFTANTETIIATVSSIRIISIPTTLSLSITNTVTVSRILNLLGAASVSLTNSVIATRVMSLNSGLVLAFVSTPSLSYVIGLFSAVSVAITSSIDAFRLASLSRTASETATVSGTPAILLGLLKTIMLGLTQAVTGGRFVNFPNTMIETITGTINIISNALLGRTASVSVTATPSVSRLIGLFKIATEAIALSITGSPIANFGRGLSESFTLVGVASAIGRLVRTITETITQTVDNTRVAGLFVSINQGIASSISVSRLIGLFKVVSQSITNSVTPSRLVSLFTFTSQGIGIGASSVGIFGFLRTATANIVASVSNSIIVSLLRATSLSITNSLSLATVIGLFKTTSVTITNTVSSLRLIAFGRSSTTSFTLGNILSSFASFVRTDAQTIIGTITAARIMGLSKTITQTINMLPDLGYAGFKRLLDETLNIASTISAILGLTRPLSANIVSGVIGSRFVLFPRTNSLNISTSGTVSTIIHLVVVASQTIVSSLSLSKVAGVTATISQAIVSSVSASRVGIFARDLSQAINVISNLASIVSITRLLNVGLNVAVASARLLSLGRVLVEAIQLPLTVIAKAFTLYHPTTIVYYSMFPYYAMPLILIAIVGIILAFRRRQKRQETV